MSSVRKTYTFKDTEIILTSEADDEIPTVTLHISRTGPLENSELHILKKDLRGLMINAYSNFELRIRAQQINTPEYTGYQLSYIGEAENKPTPADFFKAAKEWLDTLEDNVQHLGSFEAGLEKTKKDIGLNTPQPDPDDPDNRQPTWSIPNKYNKNEYAIGDVHFEIEETLTDGKYRLSFHEDMNDFPQITEITDALRKLLVTSFALKDIKISITDDTESGAFNFIIKTDELLSADDFMHHCDRLVNDVHVNASKKKDLLKGIEESIEQLRSAHDKNQVSTITKAIENALGKLSGFPEELKPKIQEIAEAITKAALQPFSDTQTAIISIQEGKEDGSNDKIKERIDKALTPYISGTAQRKYYTSELGAALWEAIPRKEPVQGRGG